MFSYPSSFTPMNLRPYFDSIDSFLALDLNNYAPNTNLLPLN